MNAIQGTLAAAGPGVVLFSKSYCPYCRRAKQALMAIGIVPVVVELDLRLDGRSVQVGLLQLTGQRTVPSPPGGSDDVVEGIAAGLFDDVPREEAREVAEAAGLKKCGADDGIACLCFS